MVSLTLIKHCDLGLSMIMQHLPSRIVDAMGEKETHSTLPAPRDKSVDSMCALETPWGSYCPMISTSAGTSTSPELRVMAVEIMRPAESELLDGVVCMMLLTPENGGTL